MAYSLQYNNVTLVDLDLQSISQEPVYTDDGVDYQYTKVTLDFHGLINMQLQPATERFAEQPTNTMNRIRKALLTPRKQLIVTTWRGDTYITSPALVTDSADAHNGPQPESCQILKWNESTWTIDYKITTWIVECDPEKDEKPEYVAHRWKVSITIDENFYTKRIVDGIMYFRSNIGTGPADVKADPDFFRPMVIPDLLPGFKRQEMMFTFQEDNLIIAYRITDQQVYTHGPPGSTRIEGSHTVTSNVPPGGKYVEQIVVRLWADKGENKATLLGLAIQVALARFKAGASSTDKIISKAILRDHLHENYVEVHIETLAGTQKDVLFGLAQFPADPTLMNYLLFEDNAGKLKSTDYSSVNEQPNPEVRGNAAILVKKAPYSNQGCSFTNIKHIAVVDKRPPTKVAQEENSTNIKVAKVPRLPTKPTHVAAPSDGVYTDYYVEQSYETDYHTIQMPVASSLVNTASFAILAAPTMKRVVKWSAEKTSTMPLLPFADSSNSNEVLLFSQIIPAAPGLMANAFDYIWRISGTYVYGIIDPSKVQMSGGVLPYQDTNYFATVVSQAQFIHGISDPPGILGFLSTGDGQLAPVK